MSNDHWTGSYNSDTIEKMNKIRTLDKIDNLKYLLDNYVLDEFQTKGVAFIHNSNRALLGDEPGLGKTLQACGFIRLHKMNKTMKKLLFVCESAAVYQILSEVLIATGLTLLPIYGDAKKIDKMFDTYDYRYFDGIITTQSALGSGKQFSRKFMQIKDDFDTIIYDESLALASGNSIRYYVAKYMFPHFKNRLMLNGTALTNKLDQMYYQLDILDNVLIPSLNYINNTYGVWKPVNKYSKMKKVVDYTNTAHFTNRVSLHYIGRSRADVGIISRPLIETHLVEPTASQLNMLNNTNYLEVLFSPTTFNENIKTTKENTPALQKLIELVGQRLKLGSIVIYAEHILVKPVIKHYLESQFPNIRIGYIDGENSKQSEVNKEETRVKFESGLLDVIIINVTKSLNLGKAQSMIFYNIPEDFLQAMLRIDRGLTGNNKNYDFIIYNGTPQINDVYRYLRNEKLVNSTLSKNYNIFSTISKQLNIISKTRAEFGVIKD